ncbi:MAG: hypothetical protein AMJ43_07755 [Coxiella sp. DG_40]|nr:MAG: hypothetical protein AMJ43_07755 [Coxiella sp. DG_40]
MAVTPNLGITLPTVGGSTDSWGTENNTSISTFDSELGTRTIDQDYNGKELQNALVKKAYTKGYNLGNISGGVTIDYTNGNLQYGVLVGNITSVTISNLPASGNEAFLTLELTQDATGSRTITLGSAYKTQGGASIVLTTSANAVDELYLRTRDAGTTIKTDLNGDYK